VGKTQCALRYATSRADQYDAVLWVDADTIPKLDKSFSRISVALGLEQASRADDRVVSRNLVLGWLSDPVKDTTSSVAEADPTAERAKWLLIFDNADDPSILADFLPVDGTGAIIVTSRDPLVKRYFPCNRTDLEPLETFTAARLLQSLSTTHASKTTPNTPGHTHPFASHQVASVPLDSSRPEDTTRMKAPRAHIPDKLISLNSIPE
jgi:hypothetical protein